MGASAPTIAGANIFQFIYLSKNVFIKTINPDSYTQRWIDGFKGGYTNINVRIEKI